MAPKAGKGTKGRNLTGRGESAAAPGRVRRVLPLVLLMAAACCAYLNAGHEEFLFDSAAGTIERPYVRDLSEAVESLFRAPWRPGGQLTYFTFALNYAVNRALGLPGFEVTGFLVVNVVVHALNGCLVFFLIRVVLQRVDKGRSRSVWIALVPALLFAVHPVQASSVAYIIQRRGTLATMFYLLGVLAYLRARDFPAAGRAERRTGRGARKAPSGRARAWPWRRVLLAAAVPLCYWLSFRSKPLGLSLPLAILALEFCLRAPDRQALRRYLGWMAAGVVATVVGMFAFLWAHDLFDPAGMSIKYWGEAEGWGPWTHFLTESRVFLHYGKLLILPLPRWSCIDHQFPLSTHAGEHYAFVAVVVHGVLLALALVGAWKGRTLAAAGLLWFYIALIPYVVLPQQEVFVEYKTYLPSVGLALILAEGLRLMRFRVPFAAQVTGVALLAGALLATTVSRNVIYRSTFNLWEDAVRKSPGHARPYTNLGMSLTDLGRYDEAVDTLEKSLRLNPKSYKAHNNLGNALLKSGQPAEAISHYAEAVRLKPDFAEAHNNLGFALAGLGRWDEAVAHFEKAIEIDPYFCRGYNNLGTARAREGRREEARRLFRQAIEIDPDYAEAHGNLGNTLAEAGQFDQAIRHYHAALRLKPDLAEARRNLARALLDSKKQAQRTGDP